VHDYVAFYFGPRSVMLYQLHTGWVEGYKEGQEPLIHLVSTCQSVAEAGLRFVFSDGHGLARFTAWYDQLPDLDKVD
jgi:ssDNA thymidine ADP-ribosyltransferase, DarT